MGTFIRSRLALLAAVALVGSADAHADAVPEFLRDDYRKVFTKRAQRAVKGEAFMTASGGSTLHTVTGTPQPVSDFGELVVIDDSGPRVRIVADPATIRLALYLPRDSLHRVTLEGAAVVARPPQGPSRATPLAGARDGRQGVGPLDPHVELVSGLHVQLGKAGPDGWQALSYRNDRIETTGFVALDKIGEVYTPSAPSRTGRQILLRANARFLDGAQGKQFARLRGSSREWWGAERATIGAGSGYWFVRYAGTTFRASGWVRAEDVRRNPSSEPSGRSTTVPLVRIGLAGNGLEVRLPEGTLLLHDGVVVGLVRRTGWFLVEGARKRGEVPLVRLTLQYGEVVLKPELPELPTEPDTP